MKNINILNFKNWKTLNESMDDEYVNYILDKISKSGIDSLTNAELKYLDSGGESGIPRDVTDIDWKRDGDGLPYWTPPDSGRDFHKPDNPMDNREPLTSVQSIHDVIHDEFDEFELIDMGDNNISVSLPHGAGAGSIDMTFNRGNDGVFSAFASANHTDSKWDEDTDEEIEVDASADLICTYPLNSIGDLIKFYYDASDLNINQATEGEIINGIRVENISIN